MREDNVSKGFIAQTIVDCGMPRISHGRYSSEHTRDDRHPRRQRSGRANRAGGRIPLITGYGPLAWTTLRSVFCFGHGRGGKGRSSPKAARGARQDDCKVAACESFSLREKVAEGRMRVARSESSPSRTPKGPSSVGCAATFSRREKDRASPEGEGSRIGIRAERLCKPPAGRGRRLASLARTIDNWRASVLKAARRS
jgi:hypothetical protein